MAVPQKKKKRLFVHHAKPRALPEPREPRDLLVETQINGAFFIRHYPLPFFQKKGSGKTQRRFRRPVNPRGTGGFDDFGILDIGECGGHKGTSDHRGQGGLFQRLTAIKAYGPCQSQFWTVQFFFAYPAVLPVLTAVQPWTAGGRHAEINESDVPMPPADAVRVHIGRTKGRPYASMSYFRSAGENAPLEAAFLADLSPKRLVGDLVQLDVSADRQPLVVLFMIDQKH